jgi:hypothetical protein
MLLFSAPRPKFRGAVVSYKGNTPEEGEVPKYQTSDPMHFVATLLVGLGLNVQVNPQPTAEDGVISIMFSGGFPDR